jgi:hypothetical protein
MRKVILSTWKITEALENGKHRKKIEFVLLQY